MLYIYKMKPDYLDRYTDYLSVTFGYATATGFSPLLDERISHDKLTRALTDKICNSREIWLQVKSTVREIESEEGCLLFDDTVIEKPHRDENELNGWHYDHSKGCKVKGANLLNCLYHAGGNSIPVSFELNRQAVVYSEINTHQEKRIREITTNELMRNMRGVCTKNTMKFKWVLADSGLGSVENLRHIKLDFKKDFMVAKTKCWFAVSEEDQAKGRFTRIDQLNGSEPEVKKGWLKGMNFPVPLVRQVFTNQGGSSSIGYLAGSDLEVGWNTITTIYQKRWQVEVFHKSLKSNAATAKSPARRVVSQANHVFASIVAVFKMEKLKMTTHPNHFALKSKLYMNAVQAVYEQLQLLRAG